MMDHVLQTLATLLFELFAAVEISVGSSMTQLSRISKKSRIQPLYRGPQTHLTAFG